MSEAGEELLSIFDRAAANEDVVTARFAVLDTAATSLNKIAEGLHVAGFVLRSDRLLAAALLCRLGSELSGGIALLLRGRHEYAAGALLRQIVEVEYLMFLAYRDPSQLEKWYTADARRLRDEFKPQVMRKAAGGLFRDNEYWHHCEVGGHPHPKARLLLRAYNPPETDVQRALLPDSVHHIRRLWTSLRLLLPQIEMGQPILDKVAGLLHSAVESWEKVEDPTILAFDGIVSTKVNGDGNGVSDCLGTSS